MKTVFALFILAVTFAPTANAEVFRCSFTEPFVSLTYDSSNQNLIETHEGQGKTRVLKNVDFRIRGPATFVLVSSKSQEIARLKLTGHGADGTETVYPYEVTYQPLKKAANAGVGGCRSSLLTAK